MIHRQKNNIRPKVWRLKLLLVAKDSSNQCRWYSITEVNFSCNCDLCFGSEFAHISRKILNYAMVNIRISDPTVNIIYRWSKQSSPLLSSECIPFIIIFSENWCYCCHDIFMSEYLTVLIFHMFVERKVQKSMQYAGCWLLVDTKHNHVNQRIRTRTRIKTKTRIYFYGLIATATFDGSVLGFLAVICFKRLESVLFFFFLLNKKTNTAVFILMSWKGRKTKAMEKNHSLYQMPHQNHILGSRHAKWITNSMNRTDLSLKRIFVVIFISSFKFK